MLFKNRHYWYCLLLQSCGALIIFWHGLPIYRSFIAGKVPEHTPRMVVYTWGAIAIALIHLGYWRALRLRPPLPRQPMPLLGHTVQFLGRIGLVFVGGLFALVFFVRQSTLEFALDHKAVALITVFSMFCYSKELDRLGAGLNDPLHPPPH